MLSIGSPKNCSAPWLESSSKPRWMAPMLAVEMLPYSVVKSFALSPTYCTIARRSLKSSSSMPLSSAILNTKVNTPCCVSFRFSMRPSSSGPMSDTVARTGWPCLPSTSQNVTGKARCANPSNFNCSTRACTLALPPPILAMPERSPLMSDMNTGTPMRLNDSASDCSVTVLPVPVAPVIRPWRLAICGSSASSSLSFLAMISGAVMQSCPYYFSGGLLEVLLMASMRRFASLLKA